MKYGLFSLNMNFIEVENNFLGDIDFNKIYKIFRLVKNVILEMNNSKIS